MDIRAYNRVAWNRLVSQGNEWTVPVTSEQIRAARAGTFRIVLTPTKPVPQAWYPSPLQGCKTLCLAGAGGQQAPILAAAGADVTVLDNSPAQLARDREVAQRDGLVLTTVEGDMADLSVFAGESFAFIFHPCSNVFVPDVRPVWAEAFRVLKPGGILLAGFVNPALYIFDLALYERGELKVRHALPYSDLTSLTPEERDARIESGNPLEFGHTLEDQIAGQLDAGFVLTGFYEDTSRNPAADPLAQYMSPFIATRAVKPPLP